MKFAHEQDGRELPPSRLTVGKTRFEHRFPTVQTESLQPWETDMKTSFLAVCATGAVVVLSAFAGTRTSPRIQPESLARMEAITSYCGAVDPAERPSYA